MENNMITFCRALNECFRNIYFCLKKTEYREKEVILYFNSKMEKDYDEHFQELFTYIGCFSYFSVKGMNHYNVVHIEKDKFDAVVGCLLLNKNKY